MGNLKTITYPNGTIAEYTYDDLNRLTYLENRTSGGTIISSYTYTLDAAGNRTKVVEHSGRTVEYTYDDTYKLREEKITNPDSSVSVISYTYDKVGNRLTKTENGFTTTYTYNDNNQLVTEDDITYSYDDNGNLKEKTSAEETIKYFYDPENHLTRAETTRFNVTITVEYEYDAEGNRVRKVIDGTIVTNYLVDTNRDYAQVLEERDGNGNLLVRYVYGHDLISQTRGGTTSYYHYDGLGSTRALTASSEAITDTYTYDAFGNLTDRTGSTTNDYLFTGEQFDANLGFYYLRARYMNPEIGRFVTMDMFAGSICDPYSLHKYLYTHANPVNNIDPTGYRQGLVETEGTSAGVGILSKINVAIIRTTAAFQFLAYKTFPLIFIDPNKIILTLMLLETAYEASKETLEAIAKKNKLDDDDDDDDDEKVTYFRVQGGTPPNKVSKYRIFVNPDGTIRIPDKEEVLAISRLNIVHAEYFRKEKRPGAEIVVFKVPKWFDDFLMEFIEPQRDYTKRYPNPADRVHPVVVDESTPGFSLQLYPPWIGWLEEVATEATVIK